jgi:hypothetical protein
MFLIRWSCRRGPQINVGMCVSDGQAADMLTLSPYDGQKDYSCIALPISLPLASQSGGKKIIHYEIYSVSTYFGSCSGGILWFVASTTAILTLSGKLSHNIHCPLGPVRFSRIMLPRFDLSPMVFTVKGSSRS